jgi:hypothetical protein
MSRAKFLFPKRKLKLSVVGISVDTHSLSFAGLVLFLNASPLSNQVFAKFYKKRKISLRSVIEIFYL